MLTTKQLDRLYHLAYNKHDTNVLEMLTQYYSSKKEVATYRDLIKSLNTVINYPDTDAGLKTDLETFRDDIELEFTDAKDDYQAAVTFLKTKAERWYLT